MKSAIASLLLLVVTLHQAGAQESSVRFFEATSGTDAREAIAIQSVTEGDYLFEGTRSSSPEGGPVAYGRLACRMRPDGLIHVTWYSNIEGSRQSEEGLLKREGNTLLISEGELEERGPTQMILKDPAKVKFTKVLKEVPMTEPTADSAEGQSVLKKVAAYLEKLAGVPVELNGTIRVSRGCARFSGSAQPAGDKQPKSEELADKMLRREFRGYLKQESQGSWRLALAGFGDQAGPFELEEVEPTSESDVIPWPLDEEVPLMED
jgi:hypothetical protein